MIFMISYESCYAAGDRNTDNTDGTDLHGFFCGEGNADSMIFMIGYESCNAAGDRNSDNTDGKDLNGFFCGEGNADLYDFYDRI